MKAPAETFLGLNAARRGQAPTKPRRPLIMIWPFELFDGGVYNQVQTGKGEKKRGAGARTILVGVRA
jgi:hypothetical protein